MIVPYRGVAPVAGNLVQLAADGVAADVRLVPGDARARTHVYALRVASANADVAGRLVAVRGDGSVVDLGGVAVARGSLGGARIAVPSRGRTRYRNVYLEVSGPRIALRVEAPPLPVPRRSVALRAGIWCAGAGVTMASVVSTFVVTGTGVASPAVAVTAATARPVAAPTAAPPPPPPARVSALSARRERVGPDDVVTVGVVAAGETGSVTLVDPAGVPLRRAPLARDGLVRFVVPASEHRESVVAKIAVRRGASVAVASVALAAPPEAPPAAVKTVPLPSPGPATPAAPGASGVVALDGSAIAGHTVRVRIAALARPVHVELQDAAGATIDAADALPGTTHVELTPPAGAANLFLVARYDRNGAEETIVQPVTVRR